MPNYVRCRLTATMNNGETHTPRFDELARFLQSYDDNGKVVSCFTLDNITPMPKELTDADDISYKDKDRIEKVEAIKRRNMEKFGYPSWYEWRICHWGCKWDSSESDRIWDNVWEFETPWSAPFKAIETLSELNPDITFDLEFADEDWGYNCGRFVYRSGEEERRDDFAYGERAAQEFAIDVWGYDIDQYEWNDKEGHFEEIES